MNNKLLFLFSFLVLCTTTFAQKLDNDSILSANNRIDSIINSVHTINQSVCLLQNKQEILPLQDLKKNITSISLNQNDSITPFQEMLTKYSNVHCIHLKIDSIPIDVLNNQNPDILIISVHTKTEIDQLNLLLSNNNITTNIILSIFGDIDLLDSPSLIKNTKAILFSDKKTNTAQKVAAQIIFGGLSASGKLKVNTKQFTADSGLSSNGEIRFQYTEPEIAGIESERLYHTIDSVAQVGIENKAFPGCQILIAKDRKIIYHKSFGFHTYAKSQPVIQNDIYDLASVTKITGPLPALMRFVDEGKIDLDKKLSVYWKDFKRSNKADVLFRDVLAHQARLTPWIPFWTSTIDQNKNFKKNIFSYTKTKKYSVEVAPQMYLNKNYRKKIYKSIKKSDLLDKKEYRYSGLAYFIFPEMIKNITHKEYPNYLKQEFYRPLGAYTIDFNAHNNYPVSRIIPTEYDNYFRNTLLHGYVDDEGCAMMGGISGNAGLFATANDLAKLLQMYLQMGEYGGKRYISEKTFKEFTKIQFPDNDNRRGLGFDKPIFGNDTLSIEKCYPAYSVSTESFGHSGFTGTFTWMDPKNNLLYIFLSNRVHPTRESRQIYEKNIRTAIHQGVYDAIESFDKIKSQD